MVATEWGEQPAGVVPLYYYVPDEICVVVSLDPAVGIDDQDWNAGVYEPVRAFLNDRITALLNPARGASNSAASSDKVNPDLVPVLARRRLRGARQVLQPLVRQGVSLQPNPGEVRPWVRLQRGDGRTMALQFYQIGPGHTKASAESWNQASAATVRELVNVINSHGSERLQDVPGYLVAVTPNWLFAAAQSGNIGGGPGTPPTPVPPDEKPPDVPPLVRFHFDEKLEQLVQEAREKDPLPPDERPVVVAVLDTCPNPADLTDEVAGKNWLLEQVIREVKVDVPQFLPPGYFAFVDHVDPGKGEHFHDGTSHDIRDHGLFAAGIIQDIAPGARIHLVRVLDNTGVGDLLLLASILARLPGELKRTNEQRLVINLSLMAALPTSADFAAYWYPTSIREIDRLVELWNEACATLALIHTSLAVVMAWLEEQGHLVVASAGNDNDPEKLMVRPEPRYPARYDNVLGVAAVDRGLNPSEFSNRGDFVVMGNGVAVYGGDLDINDQVIGVFSQPEFPFVPAGTSLNETGWARWAGTSFAAPVISAIAADLWATDPGLTPAELLTKITRPLGMTGPATGHDPAIVGLYAVTSPPALDCPAIQAKQEPR